MVKLLATYSGFNGTVQVIAKHHKNGWQAYTIYKRTTLIKDRTGNIIGGNTIPELLGSLQNSYPQWYSIFNWNGVSP